MVQKIIMDQNALTLLVCPTLSLGCNKRIRKDKIHPDDSARGGYGPGVTIPVTRVSNGIVGVQI